jgi:hypothetical protein
VLGVIVMMGLYEMLTPLPRRFLPVPSTRSSHIAPQSHQPGLEQESLPRIDLTDKKTMADCADLLY